MKCQYCIKMSKLHEQQAEQIATYKQKLKELEDWGCYIADETGWKCSLVTKNAEQAEQIDILSDEVNHLRNNEKGRKPSCLINLDLRKEIERLKAKLDMWYGLNDIDDFPSADEADEALDNLKQALAAQPQKGDSDDNN